MPHSSSSRKEDMRKNLRLIILLVILVLLLGMFYFLSSTKVIKPSAQVLSPSLSLSPASSSATVNANFDVAIVVNTQGQATNLTDAIITYDPTALQVQDFDSATTGIQVKAGTIYDYTAANIVDATNGKITLTRATNPGGTNRFTGTGTLGTITFKALKAATTPVNIVFSGVNATTDSNIIVNNTDGSIADILGQVTGGSYTLFANITFNLNLTLQGRTNLSTTGTSLKIYDGVNPSTVIPAKTDITTSSTGTSSFTLTGLVIGTTYDYKVKPSRYLTKKISASLASPMTLSYTGFRAGDFDDNDTVNSGDFSMLNSKYMQSDAVTDINQDGIVNGFDYGYLNSNWYAQGQ